MATRDYRSLQVWPRGTMFHFYGDPDGPAAQKRLRDGRGGRWRKGTDDEWREIRNELRAEMYRDRDVLACQSMLIDDLLKYGDERGLEGFSIDNIENYYRDVDKMTRDELITYLTDYRSAPDADESDDDLREAAREFAQDNPAEIYEWWLVSDWLCTKLREHGECVLDNGYGQWWGRQVTGQAMIMDGTLQQIAADYDEVQ